jgi:FlaA1/EpsC-like NDP-sugar epimerase
MSWAGKKAPRADATWRFEADLPVRQKRRRLADSRTVLALVVADVLAVVIAYAAAFLVRIWLPIPLTSQLLPASRAAVAHNTLLIALLTQFPLFYFFGLYDTRLLRQRHSAVAGAAMALGIQVLIITAWYFFRANLEFPRSVLLIFAALNLTTVCAVRLVSRHLLGRSGRPLRVALVGPAGVWFRRRSSAATSHPVEIVGGWAPTPDRS